jgi:plasmid stability protein
MIGHIPEIHAVGLPTSKAHGEAAEAAFLAKATSLGFGVAKTWGESERYDFMVDSGQKLWRVQVKSCRCFRSYYKVITRGGKAAYTADEIDFIVVYIVPKNLWYVIPISFIASRVNMYISPDGPNYREHEKYREAWCQMACPRDPNRANPLLVERQPDYAFDSCGLCSTQPVDMCCTCKYATNMSKMIQLRNVPDALHRSLKARAAMSGRSLSDYLLAEIKEIAERPTLEEFRERLHRRKPLAVEIDSARLVREERDAR